MNDPHVETLHYAVIPDVVDDFSRAVECSIQTDEFEGSLANNTLTLRPKQHFASEAEARIVADAFVLAWEVWSGVQHGRPVLRFRFAGSQVSDRGLPPGQHSIALSEVMHMSDEGALTFSPMNYPLPPEPSFRVSPDVKSLWDRFGEYRAGREPLLSMAYFCLTLIEQSAGGGKKRTHAAKKYLVDEKILDMIGKLSSERGDHATARKLNESTAPLTGAESAWLEAAILALIKHLGLPAAQELRMSDLPPL